MPSEKLVPEQPRAVLRLVPSGSPSRHRVFVLIDGEIAGEIPATTARVEVKPGEIAHLDITVRIAHGWAEVGMPPLADPPTDAQP